MRRIVLLIAIAIIAAAAPARAWCEASCLAPSEDVQAHCPSHEPIPAGAQVSGTTLIECPALESARPASPARVVAQTAVLVIAVPPIPQQTFYPVTATRPNSATTVFERCTPLRI